VKKKRRPRGVGEEIWWIQGLAFRKGKAFNRGNEKRDVAGGKKKAMQGHQEELELGTRP